MSDKKIRAENLRRLIKKVEAEAFAADPKLREYQQSDEYKVSVKQSRERYREFKANARMYWEEDYPKLSFDDCVKRWLADVHRGMRTQGEVLNDEYSNFSPRWYEEAKKLEPEIDRIMEAVAPRLGFDFDWPEYRSRIAGEPETP